MAEFTRFCGDEAAAGTTLSPDARTRGTSRGEQMIGKTGRVTGRVGPGLVGEVMLPVRGGSEAFFAHPFDPADVIPVGTQVVVNDYQPPRTVYVSRAFV
jgi:hypothetical protein